MYSSFNANVNSGAIGRQIVNLELSQYKKGLAKMNGDLGVTDQDESDSPVVVDPSQKIRIPKTKLLNTSSRKQVAPVTSS